MTIELTKQLAQDIIEAERVCAGEGIGPNSQEWCDLLNQCDVVQVMSMVPNKNPGVGLTPGNSKKGR